MFRKSSISICCLSLLFSMFVGCISVHAAQRVSVDWWVESVELAKLSDFPEFAGWSTDLLAIGDYEGYCSEDGKSFWLSGIHLSSEDVKKVEIPEKIDGMTVTRVSQFSPNAEEPNLFRECHRKREINDRNYGWLYGQKVEELVLPDSVTEIGQKTFQNMPALKKVVLPAALKKMGSFVFFGDKRLETIYLPASVSDLQVDTFQGVNNLKSISIDRKNTEFSARKNGIYSADGKTLYLLYGSKKKTFVLDSKVKSIRDVQDKSRINYVEHVLKGYKISVSGKNKTYGYKSGCLYVKKTGELLYYANKKKDPKLPACIKKLTKKTCFISPYINSIHLSKNMKMLDCRYIQGGESYLSKIIFPSAKVVKIKHADALARYDAMKFCVPKKQVKKYKKQVKSCKKIKVTGSL